MSINHFDKWWLVVLFSFLFLLFSLPSTYDYTLYVLKSFNIYDCYTRRGPSEIAVVIHLILFIIVSRLILELVY